ncbi:MAG: glycosyltransferase family 4 protein [Dorea sp.]|jgi:glycosyltransferase involved in cell wall biosynthesis|nr:glycosyltransferase family 4 protein [Dorea sp.]
MNITFLLPGATSVVSGGYSVVYQYANLLSEKGHNVRILYENKNLKSMGLLYKCVPLRMLLIRLKFGSRPRWFNLKKEVNVEYLVYALSPKNVMNDDILIATAVDTAEAVASIPNIKKYYFVQDFENWKVGDEYVISTYRIGLDIITVSNYLKDIVRRYTETKIKVVPNAIDTEIFDCICSIESRDRFRIAMLYHKLENKGSKYGLGAIIQLKKKYPQLSATLFGTVRRPKELPKWIEYIYCASKEKLCQIYNESAIFICPTIWEGFGLTPLEAMKCGCVVISTYYEAGQDFLVNQKNSLLCEVRDSEGLYINACRIIEDELLRIRLARNAVKSAKRYSWERSAKLFEKEVMEWK